jgi:osmotically-inducible protein OsmY
MRRALRRAALALLAAGVPGLARPAFAQPLPPAAPMTLPPADTAREGLWRLEEMKVEMAWLADAATFPHVIVAHSVDGNLELRGNVPSTALRDTAFRIARAHSRLPIVNFLQIDRSFQPRETGVNASAVRQGAVEVLTEAFGMAARGFEIRAETDGQVAISGSVNSVEEKLAVSRKLRKVHGCTCVSNYLQISPVMRDGRMFTQINAAGSLVVPGQVLCLDGTGQELPGPRPPAPAPAVQAMVPAAKALPGVVTMSPPAPPRPAVRPTTVQVQATTTSTQPAIPAAMPATVMPIEVPLPPALRTTAADPFPSSSANPRPTDTMQRIQPAPSPSFVTTRNDAKPAVVVVPPRPALPMARDPVDAKTVAPTRNDKEVDLLAVPTVPDTWNRATTLPPAAPAPTQKPKAPGTFATTRTEPARVLTADELLNLPAVPIGGANKPAGTPAIAPPVAAKPVSVQTRTNIGVVVAPAVPVAPQPRPVEVVVPQTKSVTTTVLQQPPAAPVLKPIVAPEPTAIKDTWVDALPAPSSRSTPGHPLPPAGGWPAAHDARPAPTAYVTSGLLVFPDEQTPVAKPVVVPVTKDVRTPAPVATRLVARVEPLKPAPVMTPPAPSVPVPIMPTAMTMAPSHAATPTADRLKQQIERACGRMATLVEVTSTDTGMTVRVKCADGMAAQKVTERILVQVPEMSDTKVKFQVEVGQ